MWTGYGAAVVATDVQRCRYPMPCDDVMVVLWCPLPSAVQDVDSGGWYLHARCVRDATGLDVPLFLRALSARRALLTSISSPACAT